MLVITGTGMVTSLGLDAASGCAAARAGIRRPSRFDRVPVQSEESDEIEPLVGHQVPIIAPGTFGFSRLTAIAAGALEDLARTLPDLEDRPLGVILVVGQQLYRAAALSAARKEEGANADELDDDEEKLASAEHKITVELLDAVLKRAGVAREPAKKLTIRGTCSSFTSAVQLAQRWLQMGECHRCLLGTVDSLVDMPTLESLLALDLIRSVDRPVGMFPGEAATFHALELPGTVTSRPAPVHALIEAPLATTGRPNPRLGGEDAGDAEPLALTLAHAIQHHHGGRFDGVVVTNLNGDEHRADVWGNTLARLRSKHDIGSRPTWFPCAAFGDPGAAVAGVSLAMLMQGWGRGYVAPANALVCLMDDLGGRTVVPVRRL